MQRERKCAGSFTGRFLCAEREDNVKADIFTAYRALLTMTQAYTQSQSSGGEVDAMEFDR